MPRPDSDGPLARATEALFERQENYGHPYDNFNHIANLWSALFGWDVQATDVALAMVLLKLSRLYRTPGHEDSATDVAGYIEAYSMVTRAIREREQQLAQHREVPHDGRHGDE